MRLRLLTPQEVQRRQAHVWAAWTGWHVRVVRAFFPDTGGNLHLMHNWYRCAEQTDPAGARLAGWVHASVWDRLRRTTCKLEAQCERNEHLLNHGDHVQPLWCRFCRSTPQANGK